MMRVRIRLLTSMRIRILRADPNMASQYDVDPDLELGISKLPGQTVQGNYESGLAFIAIRHNICILLKKLLPA